MYIIYIIYHNIIIYHILHSKHIPLMNQAQIWQKSCFVSVICSKSTYLGREPGHQWDLTWIRRNLWGFKGIQTELCRPRCEIKCLLSQYHSVK